MRSAEVWHERTQRKTDHIRFQRQESQLTISIGIVGSALRIWLAANRFFQTLQGYVQKRLVSGGSKGEHLIFNTCEPNIFDAVRPG